MMAVMVWYITVSAIGWLTWPLAFRLLPGLTDRGYTISRALGLLLVGYVFWLLCSLGFLRNTAGGILLAVVIIGGAALWAYFSQTGDLSEIKSWLKEQRRMVITAETLFLLAFVTWAIVRALNPTIEGTEKPMELAFLNGIDRSSTFPPRDPWLAGYAISYYYFGYVIVAMVAKLAGTIPSVAFNLGGALLVALTLVGSYGLVYNLVSAKRQNNDEQANKKQPRTAISALIGPLMVGITGNLEGFLELLHSLSIPRSMAFWTWLDIENLSDPVTGGVNAPADWRYWWWWRASRVIHDRDVIGTSAALQPIDEFPFFSFLLGDMHPHVLALPFVLLVIALAFNALMQEKSLSRAQYGLYIVVFGGLAFLNTWDLPITLFVLGGTLVLRHFIEAGRFRFEQVQTALIAGLIILGGGIAAYLPWYISFGSQAGGILPNPIFATRLHQYIVMFTPALVIVVWFVVDMAIRRRKQAAWWGGIGAGFGILLMLILAAAGLSVLATRTSSEAVNFALNSSGVGSGQIGEAARAVIHHRLAHPLTFLFLTIMIGVIAAVVFGRRGSEPQRTQRKTIPVAEELQNSEAIKGDVGNCVPVAITPSPSLPLKGEGTEARGILREPHQFAKEPSREGSGAPGVIEPVTGFVLLLIFTGCLLTLGSEFVYLRDNFGQRINTIFKFYYAAWILFSVAAAYALHTLGSQKNRVLRIAFIGVSTVLVLMGLVYPVLAIPEKTGLYDWTADRRPTLDGIDTIHERYPGDYAAIQWLNGHATEDDIVLEAVGGAYSYYGRVSGSTGVPTLIGWSNHERQWRGPRYDDYAGTRIQDTSEIYNTTNIARAQELIEQYGVTYVFVGTLERSPEYASAVGLAKFDRYYPVAFESDGATIYRVDQPLSEEAQ
jgi:YYY domain-containing protein